MTPTPTETAIAALETAGECIAFARDKLGMCGEGDGKDRKADASDAIGSLHALTEIRQALAALRAPVAGDVQDLVSDICEHFRVTPSGVHGQWLRYKIATSPPPAAGGMKDAVDWAKELHITAALSNPPQSYEDYVPWIKRIQADALATQPEARPNNGKEKS